MRKKAQTSKERELPKALLKNDKDNISEGNLDKKNKRKNKKDKSKNVLKIVIIFIVILIYTVYFIKYSCGLGTSGICFRMEGIIRETTYNFISASPLESRNSIIGNVFRI